MMTTVKQCKRCERELPIEDFTVDRSTRDGRSRYCRACLAEAKSRSRSRPGSRARVAAYNRAYYAARTDEQRARASAWYRANRERALALDRQQYWDDPERARARVREWYRDNPEKQNASYYRRRSLTLVRFSAEQLAARMAYWGNRCWMCGGPFEHIDHVKPLVKGGPHILANLRPACAACNQAKAARWPVPLQGFG